MFEWIIQNNKALSLSSSRIIKGTPLITAVAILTPSTLAAALPLFSPRSTADLESSSSSSFALISTTTTSASPLVTTATPMNGASPPPPPPGAETADAQARHVLKQGTRWGTWSLALVLLAVSLTLPHQQARRDTLGCDSLCLGSLTSARSALTLLGATLIGPLSDSKALQAYGGARRICLWLGILASALTVFLSYQASSLSQLWISMVPSAILQQNMSVLKALLSDYQEAVPGVSAAERAAAAGLMGMAGGLAMMFGPALGSVWLKTYDRAAAAALVALAVAAVMVGLLPSAEDPSSQRPADTVDPSLTPRKKAPMQALVSFLDVPAARTPPALFMITIRLVMTLSWQIYNNIWTILLKERFQFGPGDYGKFFSMVGLFFAISQGFLTKFLLTRLKGDSPRGRVRLLVICSFLVGLLRFWAFSTAHVLTMYALFAVMVMAVGVATTILSADTQQIAPADQAGKFFGIMTAVENGAGMAGPVLGGALSYWHPTIAPMSAVLGLNAIGTIMVMMGYEDFVLGHLRASSSASSSPPPSTSIIEKKDN